MFARLSLAVSILFSISAYAAPACHELMESLFRFPPAKIDGRVLQSLHNDQPNHWLRSGLVLGAKVNPNKAKFDFTWGYSEVLPVERMEVRMDLAYFEGEVLPRVRKNKISVILFSSKEGGSSQVEIKLPKELFDPELGTLREFKDQPILADFGIAGKMSYQNGILTFTKHEQRIYVRQTLFGFGSLRERVEYDITTVRMEIDETLTRFGRVDFKQETENVVGKLLSSNTTVNSSGFTVLAEYSPWGNPRYIPDPATTGVTAPFLDFVRAQEGP